MFEFIWTRRNHCKHNGYEWFHDRRSALFHMGAFSQKPFGLPVSHRHKVRHKVTRAILANLGPETVFSVLEGGGHGGVGGRVTMSPSHYIHSRCWASRVQNCVWSCRSCGTRGNAFIQATRDCGRIQRCTSAATVPSQGQSPRRLCNLSQ